MSNWNLKLAVIYFTVMAIIIFYNIIFMTGSLLIFNSMLLFFVLLVNINLVERIAKNGGFLKENIFSTFN